MKLGHRLGPGFLIIIFLFSILSLSYAQVVNDNFEKNLPLKVQAKSPKMIYRLDEKVIIEVLLRNTGDEPLDIIEPAVDKLSFMVEIVMPDGKKDKLLDIYGLKLENIRLYPKKRVKFVAEFVPEQVGHYQVNVTYNGYSGISLKASPVSVFVVNVRK